MKFPKINSGTLKTVGLTVGGMILMLVGQQLKDTADESTRREEMREEIKKELNSIRNG